MTTFKYDITLNDSEMIALTEAINRYIAECEHQLVDGPKAPYWAHNDALLKLKAKLHSNPTQTSGNNFWAQHDKNGSPI